MNDALQAESGLVCLRPPTSVFNSCHQLDHSPILLL